MYVSMYILCVNVQSLRLWDLTPGKCKLARYKRLAKQARACAFSPDGRFLAVGFRDGSFVVLNLEADDMPEVAAFKDNKEEISDMKFSPGTYALCILDCSYSNQFNQLFMIFVLPILMSSGVM